MQRAKQLVKRLLKREGYRPGWLPSSIPVKREIDVHPHIPEEKSELFHGFNAGSTEYEVLNWLHASILLFKATSVLETGAHDGMGTIALASACRTNGFGKVHSVEIDSKACERLDKRLKKFGLREFAEIHNESSLDFLNKTNTVFDVGFFDSLCQIRWQEFEIAYKRNLVRKMAAFHDTSPTRSASLKDCPPEPLFQEYRTKLKSFMKLPRISGGFESKLSRGLVVLYFED